MNSSNIVKLYFGGNCWVPVDDSVKCDFKNQKKIIRKIRKYRAKVEKYKAKIVELLKVREAESQYEMSDSDDIGVTPIDL